MIKEICFFVQTPFTQRDYKRYGVETLRRRGFKVSVMDMTGLINPKYLEKYSPPDPSDYKNIIIAQTRRTVTDYLDNNKDLLVIDLVGLKKESIFIYHILRQKRVQYSTFCLNNNPYPPQKSYSYFSLKGIKKAINRAINKMMVFILERLIISNPKYVLTGGRIIQKKLPRPTKRTKLILAHALDYDLYLDYLSRHPSVNIGNYCVFLDEYFPFHPDFLVSGTKSYSFDPELYYKGLDKIFSTIEKNIGIKVVIAANPRSRYDLHPDYFKGRQVEYGRTIELVANSKMVLTHCSTSVNFAIMFNKPIIFITSDQINSTEYGEYVANYAKQFKKSPINIDREVTQNVPLETKVDQNAYKEYFVNYIKEPGTPEKPFWDIVADNIIAAKRNA